MASAVTSHEPQQRSAMTGGWLHRALLLTSLGGVAHAGPVPLPSRSQANKEAFMKKADATAHDPFPNIMVMNNTQYFPMNLGFWASYELTSRPRKMALLIDDMQNEYQEFLEYLIPQVQALVHAFRQRGLPIFWSTWYRFGPDDGYFNAMDRFYGPVGTKNKDNALYVQTKNGEEIVESVKPITDTERSRTFYKIYSLDMFDERPVHWKVPAGQGTLDEELTKLGVDTVVQVGLWTDDCVIATAHHAFSLQYDVIMVEDGVATPSFQHYPALKTMWGSISKNVLTSDVLDYIYNKAVVPEESSLATSLAARMSLGKPSGKVEKGAIQLAHEQRMVDFAAGHPQPASFPVPTAAQLAKMANRLLVGSLGTAVGYLAARRQPKSSASLRLLH